MSLSIRSHHHHHQKAFRNKSHTSHGQRPGLKRNKSKGKILTINYDLMCSSPAGGMLFGVSGLLLLLL